MLVKTFVAFALASSSLLAQETPAPNPAPAPAKNSLTLGDAAPALSLKQWYKGGPVSLEADKTYIIECWATWCGPCIAAFPHLSELAKEYKDKITVIGVDVWERKKPEEVKAFVDSQGDKMSYNVAADDEGQVADKWLKAAGRSGIPCAFVVHKGKVMWIGHPGSLEAKLLNSILDGSYDLAASKKHFEIDAVVSKVQRSVQGLMRKRDFDGAVAQIDAAIAANPVAAENLESLKKSIATRKAEMAAEEAAEAAAKASPLKLGDKAPEFKVGQWYKGGPVAIADDKTYVVECWATWCGPCIAAFPHLSELAKANDKISFIGVNVWERRKAEEVKAFVESQGDKMAYNVVADADDTIANKWLRAAGQNGIPSAFVVHQGKVMWIGHPSGLNNELLKSIVDGSYDLATAIKAAAEEAAADDFFNQKVQPLLRKQDVSGALVQLEEMKKQFPSKEKDISGFMKRLQAKMPADGKAAAEAKAAPADARVAKLEGIKKSLLEQVAEIDALIQKIREEKK
ncbi:MAG: Thiol-disulfide oxidoreductase ResA [Verrucomicrobiota bacterium]|jgi:thiol-disulfide isomerase/thioredoxin